MDSHKPLIVDHVRRSIEAINGIVVSLQKDGPLSSDIIDISYSQSTVDEFLKCSETVVRSLQSASDTTSSWLRETGDRLSQNVAQAGGLEESIRETSSSLREADEHATSTQERINVLQAEINNGQANLSSAHNALSNARDKLKREKKRRDAVRIGAVASLFFAPVLSVALVAVDIAALEHSVDDRQRNVHTVESQLAASRAQLDAQHAQLAAERASKDRLASSVSSLREQAAALASEVQRLQASRTELAELSVRINDCLHTVDAALSSSKTIADMCSMRNVVSGVRGVVGALGADAMFAGPLALLDDSALGRLDMRVASVRRLQIAV
ncbi:hypothetical protein C8Q80DRAFT_1221845 [Daedaleopsis nitida]|nr:hypothetical protein C8Q80DRAFT_1221845 [Daedaleopsis nitida]